MGRAVPLNATSLALQARASEVVLGGSSRGLTTRTTGKQHWVENNSLGRRLQERIHPLAQKTTFSPALGLVGVETALSTKVFSFAENLILLFQRGRPGAAGPEVLRRALTAQSVGPPPPSPAAASLDSPCLGLCI